MDFEDSLSRQACCLGCSGFEGGAVGKARACIETN